MFLKQKKRIVICPCLVFSTSVLSVYLLVWEHFQRQVASKNILACTHLVCPRPEGRKYEAALNWGVAAVDPKWLLACARAR